MSESRSVRLAHAAALGRNRALGTGPLPGGCGPRGAHHYRQIVPDYRPVFTGLQAW
jgi:hypothetical protein